MFRILVAIAAAAHAFQAAPPATDVFLASLAVKDGTIVLGAPVNISNSPGYDNQPSFTPDGRSILFTSVRGDRKPDAGNAAATGSDVYRYDIASRTLTQITATPESEYSPTVMPDGQHISVVRVEADGTQRLWRFPLEGGSPELVLSGVKPVGYHAWIDERTLALFVLGTPNTLQLASVSGTTDVIARDIGRSLSRMPGGGISYVQRGTGEAGSLVVMHLDAKTRQTAPLVRVIPGAREADLAWTPDGLLLLAHEGRLYSWRAGMPEFAPAADLGALGLKAVTRMAVSPRGDWLALVAQP